jgi:tRNA-guanine family transglycosylase
VRFTIQATDGGSSARAGRIETAHGVIETPVFMPVGTRGTVRTQTLAQLTALGPRIVLANTYHLGRRPGAEALARFGGLHRWMGWPGAILTDSGGFQVFSLGAPVDEAGAIIDGEAMTPERSIAIQRAIGADVMMVLDHCVASTSSRAVAAEAMHRTHRWARRSLAARAGSEAALFAIVQGACDPELRRESADTLVGIGGFDGYAIGGLAVGEARGEREDVTALVTARLPADRPRYLMGVGMPIDLLEAVLRGVDLFDCILPTALAQQGVAFTSRGRLDLARGVYRLAEEALDPACGCEACARPRSYLHHLIKCGEPLGWQLIAHHNLAFYLRLMSEIRTAIRAGELAAYARRQRPVLEGGDPDHPPGRRPRVKPRKARTRGAFALEVGEAGARIVHVASGAVIADPDAGRCLASPLIARALAGAPAPALAGSLDDTTADRIDASDRATMARRLDGTAGERIDASDEVIAHQLTGTTGERMDASDRATMARRLAGSADDRIDASDEVIAHQLTGTMGERIDASDRAAAAHRLGGTAGDLIDASDRAAAAHRLGGTAGDRVDDSDRAATARLAEDRPLVVWDVGLALGERAMALIAALDRHAGHAAIELISFAPDLDAFRLALAHVEHFAHLRHRAPHVVAQRGRFERARFSWSVRASCADAPRPDVIFGERDAPITR